MTEIERVVADIWGSVLGLPGVDTATNFFDLGGRSILIPRVVARVNSALDPTFGAIDMFRNPTVKATSAFIADKRSRGVDHDNAKAKAAKRRAVRHQRSILNQDRHRSSGSDVAQ